VLFYIGITNKKMKKLLSIQWVTILGGMCYSIYLLQFIIISGSFPLLKKIKLSNQWVGFTVYSGVIIILVLCGSMIFYRIVEQPCMRKDWYKHVFRRANKKLS